MDKIEKIRKRPLRSVWKNEAHDFTPWLCANMDYLSEQLGLNNVSSTNYFTQYQRFRRTDVTISSKSPIEGRTYCRIRKTNPLKEVVL